MSELFAPVWAVKRRNQLVEDTFQGTAGNGLPHSDCVLLAFARYIAANEPEPEDPLYEALFAVVELGRYDTREQTELLRGELAKRGLKIVEAADA